MHISQHLDLEVTRSALEMFSALEGSIITVAIKEHTQLIPVPTLILLEFNATLTLYVCIHWF